MDKEKSIEVLNTLITINNDRIEGYKTAYDEADEYDLRTLFEKFSATSQKCKQELVSEVNKLGGTPSEGTKTMGKFFRVWMDVKAALTNKDRKIILNSCEYGEEIAVQTYERVLKSDVAYLNAKQQAMIKAQYASLKADHEKVKSLLDALVDA